MSVVLPAEMFWNWDLQRCCGTRRWSRTHLPHQCFALSPLRLHIDGSRSGGDGFIPGFGSGIVGRISSQLLRSQRSLPATDMAWLLMSISLCYDQLRSLISCNAAYLAQFSTRTSNIRMPAAAVCGWSFLNTLIPRWCWNADWFIGCWACFCIIFGSVSTTSLSRRSLHTYRSWFSATSERFHVIYSLIPTAHNSSF